MKKIICIIITLMSISGIFAQNYEGIIYVTPTGAGTHSGDSWANATSSIDTAQILAQTHNAMVWVAAGTYYGDTSATAESAFTMMEGVNVYGGFAGNEPAEYDLSLRDFESNASILDGQNARLVLYRWDGNIQPTWDGFTIQNGYGGAYLFNAKLSNCVIQNNTSGYYAGGVFLDDGEITNCIVRNNTALEGGGLYAYNSIIVNCQILNNTAAYSGGGCSLVETSIKHSQVTNNEGGGIIASGATVTNCLIANNTSTNNDDYGGVVFGGIFVYDNSTIINSTIVRNVAPTGAGLYGDYGDNNVVNCIVWGNGTNANNNIEGSVNCSFSAIGGGYAGENNIALSTANPPRFVNPSLTSGASDNTANVDWHLQQGSPCINVGDNSAVTDGLDLDGSARIKSGTVDLGCYEFNYLTPTIVYVTQEGAGTQTGEDWDNAMSSIESAQIVAQNLGAVVWVAAGTYYGNTTSNNAFTMHEGINVYGGFAGNEPAYFDLSQRDFETNATILDGQNARRVLNQPASFSTTTIWDGFTIQHGLAYDYDNYEGGGAYLLDNGVLSHCSIKNNMAADGGGVVALGGTVNNCIISNNTTDGGGGGMFIVNAIVKNCHILNNTAYYGGGVLAASSATISNCLIFNNTANDGGGVTTYYATISNTTIVRNMANTGSGISGLDIDGLDESVDSIINSIVWGNGISESANIYGNFNVSYSAIEGGCSGENNIALSDVNPPLFVNPSLTSGASDSTGNVDWHLMPGSPCINRGNNAAVTESFDLDGTTRIKRDTVDLGCYESSYPIPTIVYVTQEGAGAQTGEDWDNAMSSIEDAQTVAQSFNAVVWVAAGTYYGDVASYNAFTMHEGINVYGGFAGNEPNDFDLSLRDFEINATILDGQNARRVLYQPSSFNTQTTWNGFTIQNGLADYHNDFDGGGAYLIDHSTLSNCLIQNNTSSYGGGVKAYSNSTISNCLIYNNSASSGGGGIDAYTNASISNCTISNNTSYYGGGLRADGSTITNCVISNNTAYEKGGGVFAEYSPTISNCLISNNTSYNYGGGVSAQGVSIYNSTIVRNNANIGAGIFAEEIYNYIDNSIVWGNGIHAYDNIFGAISCNYTAIEGGFNGDNNITLDDSNQPLFVNPSLVIGASDNMEGLDWHLSEGSVCINRGISVWMMDNIDLDGTARIKRDTVDLGCYESNYYSSPIIPVSVPEYTSIIYVTQEGAGEQTGVDWANATPSIPFALAMAQKFNADVWVAAGTYYGDTSETAQNAFTMVEGVNVYGGFAGNEPEDYDLSLRNHELHPTILDGQHARRVLNQPYGYYSSNTRTIWDGFTIQNGSIGGAVITYNGELSHCIIQNNTYSYGDGGGVYASYNSTLSFCQVINNSAYSGGGVYSYGSTISNCLISNNTADDDGGGLYMYSAYTCTISNSTIVRNTAGSMAGVCGNCNVKNSIVWGNGNNASDNISGNVTCTYSAIEGGYSGENNIALSDVNPPLFVNPSLTSGASDSTGNVDWHLQEGSPCINVGNNAFVTESFDLDGTARIKNDVVDLGCYESDYGGSTPCTGVVSEFWHSACDSYTWNNQIYTQSGDYEQAFALENGCDSVVTLHLTITNTDHTDFTDVACDSYTWNGNTYTQSGDYPLTLTAANGCDSVVTLHLTITNTDHTDFTDEACNSYTWNSETYTESGTYSQTFTNSAGCDSVVTLHLTITNTDFTDFTDAACDTYTWNGETHTESGTYSQTFTNSAGCDSVVTLHLTITNTDLTDFTDAACDSYTWNGETHTESGTYSQTFTNSAGCDSVVTLHLTITNTDHTDFADAACNSYTWNSETYTQSGDYTQTFTNSAGCDSVVTLHLTINQPTTGDTTAVACESFTWQGETYMQSGDYTSYQTNAAGCDSIVTLHLTVNYPVHTAIAAGSCGSYLWNGNTYNESGDYTFSHEDANGCTQVDTLYLTIFDNETSEFSVECPDSCYTWNAQSYCTSGDYTQTLQTVHGCDSVVTLHLTITVSVDDYDGFDFKVYPNPTSNIVNVQCTMNNVQFGGMELHLCDAYGRLLDVFRANNDSPLRTAQIDLSRYAKGVYFVKAVADGTTAAVRKVVKQ